MGDGQPLARDDDRLPPAVLGLWDRRAAWVPFVVAGAAGVLAGGLIAAAIAAPAPTRHGVWTVAYLVLVCGVGQIVLGTGQALLAATPPSARMVAATVAAFNTANIAVLAGVITDHIAVFDAGAALLIVALVLFLSAVRRGARRGWPLHGYRLLIAALLVSIPIGMLLTTAGSS
jgi:hypothetical protein